MLRHSHQFPLRAAWLVVIVLGLVWLTTAAPALANQADVDAWKTHYARLYFAKQGTTNARTPNNRLTASEQADVTDYAIKVVRLRTACVNSQFRDAFGGFDFSRSWANRAERLWYGSQGDGFATQAGVRAFAERFADDHYATWANWLDLLKDELIMELIKTYYAYLHWPAEWDRNVLDEARAREEAEKVLHQTFPNWDWEDFIGRAQRTSNWETMQTTGDAYGARVAWLRYLALHPRTWIAARNDRFVEAWSNSADRRHFGLDDGGFTSGQDALDFKRTFRSEFRPVWDNWIAGVSGDIIRAWYRHWYAGLYTPLVDFDEVEAGRRTREFCGMEPDEFLARARRHPSFDAIKQEMQDGYGTNVRLLRGLVLDLTWWRHARNMEYDEIFRDANGRRLFEASGGRGFRAVRAARDFKDLFCSEFQDVYDGWTRGLPPDFILLAYRAYYAGLYSPSDVSTDQRRAEELVLDRCGMSWDDIQEAIRNDPRAQPFVDSMESYGRQVHTLRELCCVPSTRHDAWTLLNYGSIWSDPERRHIATQFDAFSGANEIQVFATAFKTDFPEVWDNWRERVPPPPPGDRGNNWTFRVEVYYEMRNANEEHQSALDASFASTCGEAITDWNSSARVQRPTTDLLNTPVDTLLTLGAADLGALATDTTVRYVVIGKVFVRYSSSMGPIHHYKGEVSLSIVDLVTGAVVGSVSINPTDRTRASHRSHTTAVRTAFDKTAREARSELEDVLDNLPS